MRENGVAVVTGAASGVGRATASMLRSRHGVNVVAVDISEIAKSAKTADPGTGQLVASVTDIADANDVAALAEEVQRTFGRVDYVVNCAAVDRVNTIVDASVEEWDWILGVNLRGVFLMCRALIPLMKAGGGGAIVNIGSTQGYEGGAKAALYCASKGGVHQLTRCMAIDHAADGIRVNCIAPGAIDTPMLAKEISEHADPDVAAEHMRDVPLGRIAAPDEIAAVACFLLSEEASYMTGSIVTVDGGGAA